MADLDIYYWSEGKSIKRKYLFLIIYRKIVGNLRKDPWNAKIILLGASKIISASYLKVCCYSIVVRYVILYKINKYTVIFKRMTRFRERFYSIY